MPTEDLARFQFTDNRGCFRRIVSRWKESLLSNTRSLVCEPQPMAEALL